MSLRLWGALCLCAGMSFAQLGSGVSGGNKGNRRACYGGRLWAKCALTEKCQPTCQMPVTSERQCPPGKSNQVAADGVTCAGDCACPARFPLWHSEFQICVSADFCASTTTLCKSTTCEVTAEGVMQMRHKQVDSDDKHVWHCRQTSAEGTCVCICHPPHLSLVTPKDEL